MEVHSIEGLEPFGAEAGLAAVRRSWEVMARHFPIGPEMALTWVRSVDTLLGCMSAQKVQIIRVGDVPALGMDSSGEFILGVKFLKPDLPLGEVKAIWTAVVDPLLELMYVIQDDHPILQTLGASTGTVN